VRNDSRGKLAFTINENRFSVKPLSLTGFGEQRQVLFAELKFSLSMADTVHDGTGQGTHAGSIPLLRGVFLYELQLR
jgi:hypothetical protein